MDAVAPLLMLTCALLMTSSRSEDASGMQTHENESQLKHVLVDDTHLKMEDFHAFRADPTKKTDGGKSVLELQNWCKEVLQDGKTDKDLVKDFMRKSQWNEEGIAFLHLETALTFAIKAEHGKYLADLKHMFDRQLELGNIELLTQKDDKIEVADSMKKRQFNHFVVQEVRFLMEYDCCRKMTWPTPNLIVADLLQQVLHDLSLNNASAVIFYHEKNEAEALPPSMFWIDPIIPAVLVGPRSARRIDASIKGYGLTDKEKRRREGTVPPVPLGDYPRMQITRPIVKRADPRTFVPFRFESKFKHVLKDGFVHIDDNQNRSDLAGDEDTYTRIADDALWTMRRPVENPNKPP